jgi:hypothetical protein
VPAGRERHEHRRPHAQPADDVEMLRVAHPLAKHLFGEVCRDLRAALDENAADVRSLRVGRIRAEPLRKLGHAGLRVGDRGALEPALAVDQIDDDEIGQPCGRDSRDALQAGARLDRRRQELARLHQQLEPPLAVGLLPPLRLEDDRDHSDALAVEVEQRPHRRVDADRRAVAAARVELTLPGAPGRRPLAYLACKTELRLRDDEVRDRLSDRRIGGDAEQLLGGGVPDGNPEAGIGDHHGCGSLADHIRRHDVLDDTHGPPSNSDACHASPRRRRCQRGRGGADAII